MGTLTYAASTEYEIDDRTLAHLETVIVTKLRRHEYFTLGWVVDSSAGSGRVSLSLHPGVPLEMRYRGRDRERLNRVWLDALMEGANAPGGLMLMTEQDAMTAAEQPSPSA